MEIRSNRNSRLILLLTALLAAGPVCALALANESAPKTAFGCSHRSNGWVRLVDERSPCRPDEERWGFFLPPASEHANRG